jgi:hypothetical protein
MLRVIVPGSPAPNPDELFTATYSQVPLSELTDRLLARGDTHPPLDYLLRHPFAAPGSVVGLRAVSIVAAAAVVLVVWLWMRRRGWLGAAAVGFTALSPYLIFYGRLARPYSPLILAGTVFAAAAERWSATGRRLWMVIGGMSVLVALLLESSGAVLLLGGVVLAGRRTDGSAWRWRGALAAATGAWLILWGWRVPSQYRGQGAAWIPLVRPAGAVEIVGRMLVAFQPVVAPVAAALVVAGVWCLVGADRELGGVVVRVAVVPLGAGLLLATVAHIGLERSFAALGWAPPLLLAGIVVVAAGRSPLALAAVTVIVVAVVVPAVVTAYRFDDGTGVAVSLVRDLARPGDTVAISPAALDHVLGWTFGVQPGEGPTGVTRAATVTVPGADPDGPGRLWVIEVEGFEAGGLDGRRPCPGFAHDELDVVVRCFEPEAVTPPR